MQDFNGKVVVITGGATSIGFALAKQFAERGARISEGNFYAGAHSRSLFATAPLGENRTGSTLRHRFFRKALKAMHTFPPRVITVDKNPAYPKVINELIAAKKLSEKVRLRQIKYQGNIVEQDHQGIK